MDLSHRRGTPHLGRYGLALSGFQSRARMARAFIPHPVDVDRGPQEGEQGLG